MKTAVRAAFTTALATHLPAWAGDERSRTREGAEKVFHGGVIITMDDARRQVEAVAIAAGRLADLVILDANPLMVETDQILDIKVVETFKEGKTVYRS